MVVCDMLASKRNTTKVPHGGITLGQCKSPSDPPFLLPCRARHPIVTAHVQALGQGGAGGGSVASAVTFVILMAMAIALRLHPGSVSDLWWRNIGASTEDLVPTGRGSNGGVQNLLGKCKGNGNSDRTPRKHGSAPHQGSHTYVLSVHVSLQGITPKVHKQR